VQITPLGTDVMKGESPLPDNLPIPADLLAKLQSRTATTGSDRELSGEKGTGPVCRNGPEGASAKRGQSPSIPGDAARPEPDDEPPEPDSFEGEPDEVIEALRPTPPAAPATLPAKSPAAVPEITRRKVQPSHYWTWRLLSDGFTLDECCAIRNIARNVVLDHLLRASEEGMEVRAEWCLSAELLAALDRLMPADGSSSIRSLLAQLPAGTLHEEVALYIKCRAEP
jgi:hypothetical protein